MSEDQDPKAPEIESPVNPLPPVVVALFLLIIGVELMLSAGARGLVGGPGAVGWRIDALQDYAFSGRIFDWMWMNNTWPLAEVKRFVTYLFVHGSFTHAVFVSVMLLALGKMVGEVFSAIATLAVFLVSGVVGAAVYGALLNDQALLVGGFPGVYGLIGAFTFLLWLRLGQMGAQQMRAFSLIGVLMGLQLIFALFFGISNDWIADVVGFATGFGLSFLLVPGGWARLVAILRRR